MDGEILWKCEPANLMSILVSRGRGASESTRASRSAPSSPNFLYRSTRLLPPSADALVSVTSPLYDTCTLRGHAKQEAAGVRLRRNAALSSAAGMGWWARQETMLNPRENGTNERQSRHSRGVSSDGWWEFERSNMSGRKCGQIDRRTDGIAKEQSKGKLRTPLWPPYWA